MPRAVRENAAQKCSTCGVPNVPGSTREDICSYTKLVMKTFSFVALPGSDLTRLADLKHQWGYSGCLSAPSLFLFPFESTEKSC